jgi:hypothetical protein
LSWYSPFFFVLILAFNGLGLFHPGLQESINGIEKSMDFHCVTVRELQAVITSQNATMLGLEASVHALKASRPSVPHFTDFTDKVLSATLHCPDADFHMETPAARSCLKKGVRKSAGSISCQ